MLLLSSILRWGVVRAPDFVSGTPPPLAVPILGIALVLLAVLPTTGRWRGILALGLLGAVASISVSLVAMVLTLRDAAQIPEMRLGPGPFAALFGAMVFIAGTLLVLQYETQAGPTRTYTIVTSEMPETTWPSDAEETAEGNVVSDESSL
jgi:hypothetical protein